MRYTVIWTAASLDTLAALWADSVDRQSITDAVAEVDRRLRHDPRIQGEEFYGDRLLIVDPLWITFRISEDDQIVEINDVWHR